MYKLVIVLLLISYSEKIFSQTSLGPEIGTYYHSYEGINNFDSIQVLTNDSDRGELFAGIFAEKNIAKNISLLTKLSISSIYITQSIYNTESNCVFCPVEKGATSQINNVSMEIKIFAGPNVSLNFSKDKPDINFNGRHPGVALVINSLDNTVKPVTLSLIYGVSIEYHRIILWAKYQHTSKYSETITISDKEYPFFNNWNFLSFSVGYRIFNLKKKNINSELKELN